MGLQIGDSIPEFTLKNQDGKLFNINSVLGKRTIVIYFYPKNDTPGCTKEACMFRDSYEDFTDLGAEVIGISSDSEKSHQKFASKHRLPFILLADTKKEVRKLFGIKGSLLGLIAGRETYVVDKHGKVVMVYNNLNAAQHKHRALKALKNIIEE